VHAEGLGSDLGLPQRLARTPLATLTFLGLLERADDGYRNSALAEAYLVKGRPAYFGGCVRFNDAVLYPGWQRAAHGCASAGSWS
jgi:3-hydroxy-5-methyl-1-naphthoate 3-O-methyltransferase